MPPKPRVQAPKTRAPIEPDNAQRTRRVLYGIAGAGILGVVLVLALFAFGGSSSADGGSVREAMQAAGCTLTTSKAQKRDHSLSSADETFAWNTTPPTTGPHFGEPAVYGAYTTPLQLGRVVHNLEHGAVYIMYGDDVPDEEVAKLRAFYDEDPTGMLLAPLPSLNKTIALGVWVTENANEPCTFTMGSLSNASTADWAPQWTLRQGNATIRVEPRGTRRTGALKQIDLRVEKTLTLGSPARQAGIYADVFNLGNQGLPVTRLVRPVFEESGPNFGTPRTWMEARTLQVGFRLSF